MPTTKTTITDKSTKEVSPKTISTKKTATKKPEASKKAPKPGKFLSLTDTLQQKFINCLMKQGKKALAQDILDRALTQLNQQGEKDPIKTFEIALRNATPTMEVRAKRIGGSVYQIPIEVEPKRQQSLSIRWILEGARKRKGVPMHKGLASEITECAHEAGYAFNKKEEIHRMARSNRAFAHLARY